jgi:hypothetical protein
MVPIGADQTDLTVFHFVRFPRGISRLRLAVLKRPIVSSIRTDILADARFTERLRDVPYSLDGAVFGRFDKALVYGRELLERVYFGRTGSAPRDEGAEPASIRSPQLADTA